MKKLILKCDDRESGELIKSLEKVGIYCFPERLKVGDYVDEELSLCFEYKTINDFCLSIIDGRIESQIEKMKSTYKNNFVIISGLIKDRTQDIHENCIVGMICKIICSNVNVVIFENNKQCSFFMKRIIERFKEDLKKA
jgi:ERCC4-type nuclease